MTGPRVIGGSARGRKLLRVPGDTTRPITDRVKEALFDILGAEVRGGAFLDLFGGTGSVGIEALSRGAAFARFVDQSLQAVQTIRANLKSTGFEDRAEVLRVDAFAHLAGAPGRAFDYIYLAPPQYKGLWLPALQAVDAAPGWLVDDGWVVVQIDPREDGPPNLARFVEIDRRRYGNTLLIFYAIQ